MSAACWPTDDSCSMANQCQILIRANWCQLLISQVMSAAHLPTNIKDLRISISDLVDFWSCFSKSIPIDSYLIAWDLIVIEIPWYIYLTHVRRTKMMFIKLLRGWDKYFTTQDKSFVQGMCFSKTNRCGFGSYFMSKLRTFETHFWARDTCPRVLRWYQWIALE